MLKILRGAKSQAWISKRLGFKFNKFAQWESARVLILWRDFASCCEAMRVPLGEVLFRISEFHGDPANDVALMTSLVHLITYDRACKIVGGERKLDRLLKGRQPLRLIDLLMLLSGSQYLSRFLWDLEMVGGVKHMSSLAAESSRLTELEHLEPGLTSLIPYLKTSHYFGADKHDLKRIAADLQMPEDAIQRTLKQMVGSGLLTLIDGKYVVKSSVSSRMIGDRINERKFIAYWINILARRLLSAEKTGPVAALSCRPVTASEWAKIHTILDHAYAECQAIMDQPKSEPVDEVVVFGCFDFAVTTKSHISSGG